VVEMNVPGYTADDIEVKATKKIVQVFGTPNKNVAKGRWTNGFYVSLPITEEDKIETNGENVGVNLTNGILTLTFPVAEEHRSTTLTITEGQQE